MSPDSDRLRRHSRWLSALAFWLFLLTALVLVLSFGAGVVVVARRGDDVAPITAAALAVMLPSIFYLYAVWAIRSGFRDFARGGAIGPVIAAGCRHAGWALAIGGGLSAVGIPNLQWWLATTETFRGMRGGALLHFDVAYLAVGVVGLALVLMGDLLARAGEAQAEARQLRDELDAFF